MENPSTEIPLTAPSGSIHQTPPIGRAAAMDPGEARIADWILELDGIAPRELAVLLGIHYLQCARRHGPWLARSELCRAANVDPGTLGRTVDSLRTRGLLHVANHPRKSGLARYVLIVQ